MRILIIDFYHSTGNVGGLRWGKFAKYLPDHGIHPIILTSGDRDLDDDNVFHCPYILKNAHANNLSQRTDGTFWGRIKRFIRGNFLIPDPRRLWFAYADAKRLVEQYKIPLVITTGPPHSVHLIGLKLKKKLGVKWIADFRDPWFPFWYEDFYLTKLALKIQHKYEIKVLDNCDCYFWVEDMSENGFNDGTVIFSIISPKIIDNCYDLDDFNVVFEKKGGFVYVGSLSDSKLLPQIGYRHIQGLSHQEAIKEMLGADYLLVAYPEDVIPSKIYEYIASGRPILSFGIRGKGAELIERCGAGKHFDFISDSNCLPHSIDWYKWQVNDLKRNESEIQKYDVREIVKEIARIIYYLNKI